MEFEYFINGENLTVIVTYFFSQPPHLGSPWTCHSSEDYYGYEDIEYTLLDEQNEEFILEDDYDKMILADEIIRRYKKEEEEEKAAYY